MAELPAVSAMLPSFDPFGTGEFPVADAARLAEALGFAGVWAGDHLSYHAPVLDCVVSLAAAATVGPEEKSSGRPSIADPPTALYDFAHARSGDKGTNANVGIIAREPKDYERLRNWLTADRVAAYFEPLGIDGVERFELPNLGALNFMIRGVLRRRLRIDPQGKTLGQALLEMPLDDTCR